MHSRLALRFTTSCCLLALAGLAQAQGKPSWTGTWKGANGPQGATLSIMENGGTLDAWGKDEAYIYRLVCVVDPKNTLQASCVGDGANHARGTRFTYRSTLTLSASGVVEKWQAQEHAGGADGQESFVRVPLRP